MLLKIEIGSNIFNLQGFQAHYTQSYGTASTSDCLIQVYLQFYLISIQVMVRQRLGGLSPLACHMPMKCAPGWFGM